MAAQRPDTIYIDGQRKDLYSNPLESYWEVSGKKKPKFYELDVCKRGYIASWAIEESQLLLTNIKGDVCKTYFLVYKKWIKANISTLFPKAANRKVMASWYTGKLRIPNGSMISYSNDDYNSRFEKEMIVWVKEGRITKVVVLDYSQQTPTIETSITS